jgi:hypothetical protein
MAVEIHVLSGSQQGRCLRFDGHRIVVGDDAAADVRFDPDREAAARRRSAVLTLDVEEGWRIANQGAGVWHVNQTALDRYQSHRLRSEDLLRVSELGPDLRFRLVSGSRGSAISAPAAAANGGGEQGGRSKERGARSGEQEEVAVATEVVPLHEPGRAVQIAPRPRPKRRRVIREASPLGRLIGILISGLFGLACAYGIACRVGGDKNDVFHVFYKKAPQAPLLKSEGSNRAAPRLTAITGSSGRN